MAVAAKTPQLGLAFCTNVIPVDDLSTGLSRLHQWGYDAVELWPGAFERYSSSQLRTMLAQNGLACAQVSPSLDFTGSKAVVENSYRLGLAFVKHAQQVGAPLLRILTGKVRGEHASLETWRAAIDVIRRLCKVAADNGVTLALETVRDSLAETTRHSLRILEEVDSTNLKLNLQLPLRGEDFWDTLRICGKFTAHMHVHNWQLAPSPDIPASVLMSQITYISAGVIDYRTFLQATVASGFSGCLSIEHGTHHGRHAWNDTALRDGRYMRHLINELIVAKVVTPYVVQ